MIGAAAAAVGFGFSEREDWRAEVVEYMQLYTSAPFNPDPAMAAVLLKGVGDKVGVTLAPENTAVRDLRLRAAFNLDGAPLAEIAYTDAKGDPAAFCVLANGEKMSPLRTEARDGSATRHGRRTERVTRLRAIIDKKIVDL